MSNVFINKENEYLSIKMEDYSVANFEIETIEIFLSLNNIGENLLYFLKNITKYANCKKGYNYNNCLTFKNNSNYYKYSNQKKIIFINSLILWQKEKIENFNEKNIHPILSFKNLNKILSAKKEIDFLIDDIKENKLEKYKLDNQDYTINEKIIDEFEKLKKILNKFNENNIFLEKDFKVKKSEDLIKTKKTDDLNLFFGYYLFDKNHGWVSIGAFRKNSKHLSTLYAKTLNNAAVFTKNIDLVCQELGLNKENLSVVKVKIEPIDVVLSNNLDKTNFTNEIYEVKSIVEKKIINNAIEKDENIIKTNLPKKITKI